MTHDPLCQHDDLPQLTVPTVLAMADQRDPNKSLWDSGYLAALSDAIDEVERLSDDENCLVLQGDVVQALRDLRRGHGA